LALLLASFSLSGCAKYSEEVRPITPPTPQTHSVQVEFKRFVPNSGDIVDYTRAGDLTERIASFSDYKAPIRVSKIDKGYRLSYPSYSEGLAFGKTIFTVFYWHTGCSSNVVFDFESTSKNGKVDFSFPKNYVYSSAHREHNVLLIIPFFFTKCSPLFDFDKLEADAKKIFAGIGKLNFKEYPTPEVKSVQPISQTLKTGYNAFPKVDPICQKSIIFPSPDTWNLSEQIKLFSARKDLRVIKQGSNYRLLYGHAAFDIKSSLTSANDLRFELQKTYNYEPSSDKPAIYEADAKNIVSKLNALPVEKQTVESSCSFSGEADSKYGAYATLKGFSRVLERHALSNGLSTDFRDYFVLPVGSQTVPLLIDVQEYTTRRGAKVTYYYGEARASKLLDENEIINFKGVRYTIDSDGKVKGVTAADIQKAENLIKAIIKDPDVALR
jgi:hypothetical protein